MQGNIFHFLAASGFVLLVDSKLQEIVSYSELFSRFVLRFFVTSFQTTSEIKRFPFLPETTHIFICLNCSSICCLYVADIPGDYSCLMATLNLELFGFENLRKRPRVLHKMVIEESRCVLFR